MPKKLSELSLGEKIKYGSIYKEPIVWKIADKNHPGYPENSVTLKTNQIVKVLSFDAQEPKNSVSDRQGQGNNRYIYSNYRQWCNSDAAAGQWYSPQHGADQEPSTSYVLRGANAYNDEAGFLHEFTLEEKSALLPTTIVVGKAEEDGGGTETCIDKIFPLSCTEVGVTGDYVCGSKMPIFSDDGSRIVTVTPSCAANADSYGKPIANNAYKYWLRDARKARPDDTQIIRDNGYKSSQYPRDGRCGVVLACNISAETLVSDSPDFDGAYVIQWNQPPTAPSSISFGAPKAGKPLQITCGESTDPESDQITYVFERQIDSGSWSQIANSSSTTVTDTVPNTGTNYNVRVKARDNNGNESDYRTGTAKKIVYNQSPSVPASIAFGEPRAGKQLQITCAASTDPDGNPITYIWERQIDSGGWTQIGSGASTSITDTVPSRGTNYNVRVKARDSEGAESGYCTGLAKTIIYNQPPTTPGVPQYKYPIPGDEMTVKWQASTDSESGTVTYVVETKAGSEEWMQAGETVDTSYQVNVPKVSSVGVMFAVRVKAKDIEGAESAHATGAETEILYHKVVRKIPWSKGTPFKARQFTRNDKKQYQTMLEGALVEVTQ